MTELTTIAGPHAHEHNHVTRIMLLVMLALAPATLFGMVLFGWPAVLLFAVTVVTAVLAEVVCLAIAGRPVKRTLFDGSALLTGWLLAMTLPPWAPWWIGVVGALLAIVVAKQVFGGIGQNLFNPAMVARVALLISFPVEMTTFVQAAGLAGNAPGFTDAIAITFGGAAQPDAFSSATVLGHLRTELTRGGDVAGALSGHFDPWALLLGNTAGSMGETSALLILLGGLWLIYKRVISWHIPLSMLLALAALATVFHLIDPGRYAGPVYHVVSGAALLGAFFIATDLVTSPVTPRGQLLFGAGCGLLVYVIRTWTNYPEGVAFAVMLMNACTPLIDHYIKPRIYGRTRRGEPLSYPDASGDDA
ncbi:MAG: RnfABCDGE type electron transport complex subunit D [Gammaproteobacteria bacterium]|nr:RnfABCDGE type electron transport complex subunit D [Gammaproteobacteria bacterium]